MFKIIAKNVAIYALPAVAVTAGVAYLLHRRSVNQAGEKKTEQKPEPKAEQKPAA